MIVAGKYLAGFFPASLSHPDKNSSPRLMSVARQI